MMVQEAARSITDIGAEEAIPSGVRKSVMSIMEIAREHEEGEVYRVLKESGMDVNEATEKLLSQAPFHEVKRKRDKKKEHGLADNRKPTEQGRRDFPDSRKSIEQVPRDFPDSRKPSEQGPRPFFHRRPMEQGPRSFIDRRPMEQGLKNFADRRPMEQNQQFSRPPTYWHQNARRGGFSRNPAPGPSQEFRVVRDNRVIDAKSETTQLQVSESQKVQASESQKVQASENRKVQASESQKVQASESQKVQASASQKAKLADTVKNSAEVSSKLKQSDVSYPKRHVARESHVSGPHVAKHSGKIVSNKPSPAVETQTTVVGSSMKVQQEVTSNAHATSSNSVGVYSSSSDPVHVPSSDSRTAGTAGAIRREVGVVGVRKPPSDRPTTHVTNKTHSGPSGRKDIPPQSALSSGHTSKSNQTIQPSAPSSNIPSLSNRSFLNSQNNNKLHQQTAGQQKALPPSMEWKPKPNSKLSSNKSSVVAATPTLPISRADNSTRSSTIDATGVSEKSPDINMAEVQHVIIPQHLRVPESQRTTLTFGSFGDEFESPNGQTSSFQTIENMELIIDEPSLSVSGSGEDVSGVQGEFMDGHQSDSPASDVESDQPPSGTNPSFTENIVNYGEIGLVQSPSPPFSSSEPSQLQHAPAAPGYQAYNTQVNYEAPFFRTVDDNVRGQIFSPSELLSTHAAINNFPSSAAVTQQQAIQQQQQQQQQAVMQQQSVQHQQQAVLQQQSVQQQQTAQLYPQLQISHFPNYMPYRQMFSPLFVPPMAIPNYPNAPSYPHPTNGSSYVLMPGGSSHLNAGGMKFAASQYKPVPAGTPGYGNFANPAGFTINAPTSVGSATGLEDVSRIKYKDNNLYIPNAQQAESTDMWGQTPREVPGLQSAQYYNLSGQAAHAFMPTQAGHGTFNVATQPSHVQYPALYHPAQSGSIPSSHHMVHQQVNPGFGQGVGLGVAAPGQQVGTYQQPQVGLNWSGNF